MILLTHPVNQTYIEDIVSHMQRMVPEIVSSGSSSGPLSIYGTPFSIKYDDSMPTRNLEQVWVPPPPGKFCVYGPEDESWMKPLGVGRWQTVDHGPLFYMMDESKFRFDMKMPLQFKL